MTGSQASATAGAVNWLTAQSIVFGAMAALLGIVANAMFLDAYGSSWLPATYVAIGVAGVIVSGAVARTARRFDLLGISLTVLGAAAAGLGLSWLLARGGALWVSVPLLVLFPILIQLGFVFIGGQAGRLLDIAGIKASFPRIMTGFPVGAVIGGVLGGQLVSWLGRTEDLLLATALAQATFVGLVWVTGVRYAGRLSRPNRAAGEDPLVPGAAPEARPTLRHSLANRFVALILAYQVLSALGSQLADFLVFDRANAQFPEAADLARYIAGYTAVMNVVSIGFLFLVAGPLLRRFGLRLGIASNPLVLTVLGLGMIATEAVAGGGSLALLMVVSAARIADIALTDGTTRTSINATYQVLPERERLPVQAAVEGIGVPVAIGVSGVLILVLNALPFALTATIAVTVVTCAVWTWAGVLLYREYGPALVDALRRRPLLVPTAELEATPGDEALARDLLRSPDPRTARLGLDLLTAMSSLGLTSTTERLALDRGGGRLEAPADREAQASLLADRDPAVRSAALDAIGPGDTFALEPALAAVSDGRTAEAAAGALGRLGEALLPSLDAALDAAGSPAPPSATRVHRLVRAASTPSIARDELLGTHVRHRDRELGLAVMERLVRSEPAGAGVAEALDAALVEDVDYAVRTLAAIEALGYTASQGEGLEAVLNGPGEPDAALRRALGDELDLVRQRVRAGRVARHGSAALGPVMVELGAGGPGGALAVEALEVLLGASEARVVAAILLPDLPHQQRLARLPDQPVDLPVDAAGWLRDLVADPGDHWRSAWLRACAVHAATARGFLDPVAAAAARQLGDPIVDELLRDEVRQGPIGAA